MLFGQNRDELRQMYIDAWRKQRQAELLSPLEAQIADVVAAHPEYHAVIEGGDVAGNFSGAGGHSNPYLHMGLHLAVREQVSTNRPHGITNIFNNLQTKLNSKHDAEHQIIECLAESLWEAQNKNQPPDEQAYLDCLRQLI